MALEVPPDAASLYRARAGEVERLRPIMQGDVFNGVELPGLPYGPGLAMVMTHPCTMRTAGGALRTRLLAARVRPSPYIPPGQWPNGHFRVLPLPELNVSAAGQNYAAEFEELATVPSGDLDLDRRVACLSDYGIIVLQQRRVHSETRVEVEVATLYEQAAPNLEEAELLHEWLEDLVLDEASNEEIGQQTAEFDALLSANNAALRESLKNALSRAAVRKAVRDEIGKRSQG